MQFILLLEKVSFLKLMMATDQFEGRLRFLEHEVRIPLGDLEDVPYLLRCLQLPPPRRPLHWMERGRLSPSGRIPMPGWTCRGDRISARFTGSVLAPRIYSAVLQLIINGTGDGI